VRSLRESLALLSPINKSAAESPLPPKRKASLINSSDSLSTNIEAAIRMKPMKILRRSKTSTTLTRIEHMSMMRLKTAMKTTMKPGKELNVIFAEPQKLAHRMRRGTEEKVLPILG
jgi:hypothetical protein